MESSISLCTVRGWEFCPIGKGKVWQRLGVTPKKGARNQTPGTSRAARRKEIPVGDSQCKPQVSFRETGHTMHRLLSQNWIAYCHLNWIPYLLLQLFLKGDERIQFITGRNKDGCGDIDSSPDQAIQANEWLGSLPGWDTTRRRSELLRRHCQLSGFSQVTHR